MNEWTEQREQEIQTRALTTVDDDMVERAAMVMCTRTTHPGARRGWDRATPAAKDAWREDARAVLDAAIGHWHDYPPCNATPATEAK